MFSTFCKLLFVYVVLTLLFSDFALLKEPGAELFRQQAAGVKSGYNKFVGYVDNTVIPKVDTFFDENGDNNLAGTIIDKL